MYIIICLVVVSLIVYISYHYPVSGKPIHYIEHCLFFRRLKLNLDVHEFILDSGTIANTNITSISGLLGFVSLTISFLKQNIEPYKVFIILGIDNLQPMQQDKG
jgi:hypothetical protein